MESEDGASFDFIRHFINCFILDFKLFTFVINKTFSVIG